MAGGRASEDEILSKQMSVERKRVYFNLRQNERGRFLKIAEVTNSQRSTIIIPESGWIEFRDILNGFITGEHLEREGIALPPLPAAADAGPAPEPSGLQLWVENLPWETTEESLRMAFNVFGELEECRVNTGRGRRGTATVRFASAEAAAEAIRKLDGEDFGGRAMRVRLDRFA